MSKTFNPDFKSRESQDAAIALVRSAGIDPNLVDSASTSAYGYEQFLLDAEGNRLFTPTEFGPIYDKVLKPWPAGFPVAELLSHLSYEADEE